MALYRLRMVWQMRPGVLTDVAIWSWAVESATVPDASACLSKFTSAMGDGTFGGVLRSYIPTPMKGILFEVTAAAGGELFDSATATAENGTGGTGRLPGQLAMVVNAQISTVRGVRTKGRTFYGPFSQNANITAGVPHANLMNGLLSFSTRWHNELAALGHLPVVVSGDGTVSRGPIVTYSVDDSWATLRTRRWATTVVQTGTP